MMSQFVFFNTKLFLNTNSGVRRSYTAFQEPGIFDWQDIRSSSACGTDGCLSTTGFATIVGDDPLWLVLVLMRA